MKPIEHGMGGGGGMENAKGHHHQEQGEKSSFMTAHKDRTGPGFGAE